MDRVVARRFRRRFRRAHRRRGRTILHLCSRLAGWVIAKPTAIVHSREPIGCALIVMILRQLWTGRVMKNLFEHEATDEVISRIDKLQPRRTAAVGKDGCGANDGALFGGHWTWLRDRLNPPRILIGRLHRRRSSSRSTPMRSPSRKNNPTDKKLLIADQRDFSREQERLKVKVRQFHRGRRSGVYPASASRSLER